MDSPFSNTATEHGLTRLEASSGSVPPELRGLYIKNGPGDFKVRCEPMEHWFDGFAMLRSFRFDAGQVHYKARYLLTRGYTETKERGRLRFPMFVSTPKFRWWEYARELIKGRQSGHNSNISVHEIAGRYFALTESKGMTEFDPESLEVIEQFEFDDDLNRKSKSTTAHPIADPGAHQLINFETVPGPTFWHHYFSIDTRTMERQMIGKIGGRFPSYIHSFGLTPSFIIHIDYPLVAFPVSLLLRFGFLSYAKLFKWKPEFGTKISLINRVTGEVQHVFEAEAFFAFHIANAWEMPGGRVVFDVCAWPSNKVIDDLYLDRLRESDHRSVEEECHLTRYTLDLGSGAVRHEVLAEKHIETPTFNEQWRFREYRFCYGVSADRDCFDNSLIKIDFESGEILEWSEDGVYAGEPLFVANPGAAGEDDGKLISLVVSPQEDASFLLILAARDLSEVCRIPVPGFAVPSVHGGFFPAEGYALGAPA